MFIVAGLGNPDSGYAKTRHNFGFMAVDAIARRYNFTDFRPKYDGLVAEGNIDGAKTLLLKPLTFMNLSGKSVCQPVSFYKVPLSDVVVIHDDMDIEFGKLKAKIGGSPAGHNGLKSIDEHIGHDYVRLRLGIGHPAHKDAVTNYVLSSFSQEEEKELPFFLADIADAFPSLLMGSPADFTNKFSLLRGK